MTTLNDKLKQVLSIQDETECAKSFEKFCQENFHDLPLPGENSMFDRAMWMASQFLSLSKSDEEVVKRVTNRMEAKLPREVSALDQAVDKAVFHLKDLLGQARETAIGTWQDMLSACAWQQMVPAGATRGVGSQLVSLGTFEKVEGDVRIQVNLGWMVDQNNLRLLLQAKDSEDNAIADVEVRVTESDKGLIYSSKTNQDGAVVAPAVKINPGQYQIQVFWSDKVVETPFFRV
ncbi:MAG: carboxypeptidase regulatory-like domain-containing protein [Candidatus Obscuribacter sp.]|nr:carboxypeptidase regulatory-like domain-containing protein [Candidatus Obscuribacter sp.]MBK9281156.1 carboxypeptidase regulatory-like domain-containing protein [Candidatus Obscuribacter sp.]MBL8083772.1 carboxypeptidase regulatory-like domain-containing protein [Candidatus Obscuribacter sp.]